MSLISKSPRIATNRSQLNSGANNPFRPSVAVRITSFKWCSGNVSFVVRKVAPHVLLVTTTTVLSFLSIKHSISSTSCDVQLLNRSYGVYCSFRHARLRGWSWKCVAVLSRRYAWRHLTENCLQTPKMACVATGRTSSIHSPYDWSIDLKFGTSHIRTILNLTHARKKVLCCANTAIRGDSRRCGNSRGDSLRFAAICQLVIPVTAASAGHGLLLWWPAGYPSANNNAAATFITEHRLADKATLVWSRESDTLADKIMAFIVLRDESKDKLNRRRYRHFDFVTKWHAGSEWLLG